MRFLEALTRLMQSAQRLANLIRFRDAQRRDAGTILFGQQEGLGPEQLLLPPGHAQNPADNQRTASPLDAIDRILGGAPEQFVEMFTIRPLDAGGTALQKTEHT